MQRLRRLVGLLAVTSLVVPFGVATVSAATTTPSSCVISLSPTATETLFAIGAGSQVKAVDTDSNFPLRGLPHTRINAFSPSVEGVLGACGAKGVKPHLVVISYDANSIAEKLRAVGVTVLNQSAPTSLAGAYAQITALGAATGHLAAARSLVATMSRSITESIASVPRHPGRSPRVYYELDPTLYSLTSSTFVGSILQKMGTVNIADPKNTSADAGYPQLNAEYVVAANPQVIFLADTVCCHASPASVAHRAGFNHVQAVTDGHVVALNDDVASRWGPRLPILVADLARAIRGALADSRLWVKSKA